MLEPVPYLLLNVRWCRHELLPQAHVCATRRYRAGVRVPASPSSIKAVITGRSVEAAREMSKVLVLSSFPLQAKAALLDWIGSLLARARCLVALSPASSWNLA